MLDLTQSLLAAGVHRMVGPRSSAPATVPIKKADDELQVVWGEVYVPGVPDSQDDFMTAETIREMAWGFMRKQALDKIDVQHDRKESGSIPSAAMRIPPAALWWTGRPPQPLRIAHSRTLRCRPTTCQTQEPAGLDIPPNACNAWCTRRRA